MKSVLIVALGGATGSVFRYLLSSLTFFRAAEWRFPASTFAVNIAGCLLVGVLAGLMVKHHLLSLEVRLFLFTGLAGGFTTFSAFGLETFNLLRQEEIFIAASYVVSSVAIGLIAVWLGYSLVSARG